MSSKQKQGSRGSVDECVAQIERSLAKGQVKQALKDAKVAYRERANPALRSVLEQAFVARTRELIGNDLHPQAQDTVKELLALGVSDPSVRDQLGEVLPVLGLLDAANHLLGGDDSSAEREKLLTTAVDSVIVHASDPSCLPAEVRASVIAVLGAIEAVEAGREADGLALLKDIPRSSPVADWKLFLRGWAAFRRGDEADKLANWQRLAPDRRPRRAAAMLEAVLSKSAGQPPADSSLSAAAENLHRELTFDPIAADLGKLRQQLVQDDWMGTARSLRRSWSSWKHHNPALAQRIFQSVFGALVRAGAIDAIDDLARGVDPLPIDPRWNRARALCAEGPRGMGPEEAARHWGHYLDDLANVTVLSDTDRTLAQSLVWLRLGQGHVEDARYTDTPDNFFDDENEFEDEFEDEDEPTRKPGVPAEVASELNFSQRRAVECLEESIRLSPDLLPARLALANAYEEWELPARARQAREQLLARFPEHFETLIALAEECVAQDEPRAALPLVRRAHRLKPLDASVCVLGMRCQTALARQCAQNGDWPAGRVALDEAERFLGNASIPPALLVCRGLLELMAGNSSAAEDFFQQARQLVGSAPVSLLQAIESQRFRTPEHFEARFDAELRAEIKKRKPNPAEIAHSCDILANHIASGIEYPSRAAHVALMLEWIKKRQKDKFEASGLKSVCGFALVNGARDLASSLAVRGRKAFPNSAVFPFLQAEAEIARGPARCNRRKAQEQLARALELAEASTCDKERDLIPAIREQLNFLKDVGFAPLPHFADNPADDGVSIGDLKRMIGALCKQMGLDPDEVANDILGGRLPPPGRSRKGDARQ